MAWVTHEKSSKIKSRKLTKLQQLPGDKRLGYPSKLEVLKDLENRKKTWKLGSGL